MHTGKDDEALTNDSSSMKSKDCLMMKDDNQAQDYDRGVIVNAADMTADLLPQKKRKKRANRPASKRGLGKPTGFESSFADTPLTAEQHAELQQLYDKSLPLTERIVRAVNRFERTRKLSSERRDIFYKYLTFGGFEAGPSMFQGQQDVTEMTKIEAMTALAQVGLSETTRARIYDPKAAYESRKTSTREPLQNERERVSMENINLDELGEQFDYVVDFHTTMCSFLSRRAPAIFGLESVDMINLITTTLERFMDYLLQHDVCNDYTDEILATRNLCRHAQIELGSCVNAQTCLPGDFNIACSTLSGGPYSQRYDGSTYWGELRPGETAFVGLTSEKAQQIVGFAMAATANDEMYNNYTSVVESAGAFEIIKTISGHGFEIVDIERATQECRDVYRANTAEYRPVGKVYTKFWKNPESPPEDITEDEVINMHTKHVSTLADTFSYDSRDEKTFTFLLEDSNILPHLRIGQKIECTMYELNCGVWYFDEVIRVYPSFDIWIENELMLDWKDPKPAEGAVNPYSGHLAGQPIKYAEIESNSGQIDDAVQQDEIEISLQEDDSEPY